MPKHVRARTHPGPSSMVSKPAAFVVRNISPLMSAIVLAGRVSRQYVNGLTPPQYGNNRASSFSSSLLSNIVDAYTHIYTRAKERFYSRWNICIHSAMFRPWDPCILYDRLVVSRIHSNFENSTHAFSVSQLDSLSFDVLVFPTARTRPEMSRSLSSVRLKSDCAQRTIYPPSSLHFANQTAIRGPPRTILRPVRSAEGTGGEHVSMERGSWKRKEERRINQNFKS